MDSSEAIELCRQAVTLMLVLGAPALLAALIVGLIVSLFQAATQVQEPTLSFVPKIIATLAAVMVAGPWMLQRLIEFSRQMFGP
jgi:flagellar biosynthetic protein FliQ